MDMRHRSTPVSTCQRYALAVNRVNSATAPGRAGPPGWLRVRVRHAAGWGYCLGSLWTTVDPQARELLASVVPGNPNSTDRPSWPISGLPIAVTISRSRQTADTRDQTDSYWRRLTSNRDNLRTLHNLWTKVWSLGIRVCATAQPKDRSATGRGCRKEHRYQPGKPARGPLAGHRRQPPSQPAGLADLQQAVDARREHRRGRRTERVHPQPARRSAAHPHRGHPQRAARQAGPPRRQRGPHPGARDPRPAAARLAPGRQPGAHQRSGSHPGHRRLRRAGVQRPVEPGDGTGQPRATVKESTHGQVARTICRQELPAPRSPPASRTAR